MVNLANSAQKQKATGFGPVAFALTPQCGLSGCFMIILRFFSYTHKYSAA